MSSKNTAGISQKAGNIMKKILIITTGGTIAMKKMGEAGVLPNNEFIELIRSFPQINTLADIFVYEFANIPSPHMTPELMFRLSSTVDEMMEKYDGFVITHGTDTLEETAYFLHLSLRTRKPVVFTAAMRSGSELGLDGPRNIVNSVRVACDDSSIDKGVLVVMNDEIHAARDVTKFDTGKVNTFTSPGYGYLGIVDSDKIIYYRETIIRENIWTDRIERNVDLITTAAGMDGRFIDASVRNGAKGIVIEALGRGNVPPTMIESIKEAISKGIVLVVVSRTITGRVLPEYGYDGGGLHLKKLGVKLGYDLRGPKARIALMLLLGKYNNFREIPEDLII